MHCSISWDILFKIIDASIRSYEGRMGVSGHLRVPGTKNISVVSLPFLVKILFIRNNQLVTKNRNNMSYLVGTSETTRASSCYYHHALMHDDNNNKGFEQRRIPLTFRFPKGKREIILSPQGVYPLGPYFNEEENLFNE
jgi:hypothetical protein